MDIAQEQVFLKLTPDQRKVYDVYGELTLQLGRRPRDAEIRKYALVYGVKTILDYLRDLGLIPEERYPHFIPVVWSYEMDEIQGVKILVWKKDYRLTPKGSRRRKWHS